VREVQASVHEVDGRLPQLISQCGMLIQVSVIYPQQLNIPGLAVVAQAALDRPFEYHWLRQDQYTMVARQYAQVEVNIFRNAQFGIKAANAFECTAPDHHR